jgi:hypothetical protein
MNLTAADLNHTGETLFLTVTRLNSGRIALDITTLHTTHGTDELTAALEPAEARELGETLIAMAHATEIGQ